MQNILRELLHGNLQMLEGTRFSARAEMPAFQSLHAAEERLEKQISEEQRTLLKEYGNAYMNLLDVCCESEFINGYRFGVQMMLAAWPEELSAEE